MNQPSPPMALRLSGEGCLSAPARGLHGAAGLQRSSLMRIDHFGAVTGHSAADRSDVRQLQEGCRRPLRLPSVS